ncbi:Xaa-Pro peptidase family protein, partial [Malonomonas rubra]|uniref:M24 family metallopeptidase n=1 Tax=Malonomonas rubra TaxID=57040 RepID=UPI0026E933BC
MVKGRGLAARNIIEEQGLDALLFTDMANIRYLCGFTGSEALLLVTLSDAYFLTDSRYTTQAEAETGMPVRTFKVKHDGIVTLLRDLNCSRVGFEAAKVSYALHQELKSATTDISWVPVTTTDRIRQRKDEDELSCICRAADYNAAALQSIRQLLIPGARECDIALELEVALRKLGGEDKAFDFIVASGERGALPHGVASTRRLAAGELITIDFGTRCNGYYSDETVTLAIGSVADDLRRLHDVVLEAHDRAIAAVKPGERLADIDAVAREYIAAQGFGDYFGHGLGHGVGLEVHEWPRVSPQSKAVAEVGMVFTIEPGIYLPGKGGVRIEDIVAVTASGCRVLT